jgi:hypothetical protein
MPQSNNTWRAHEQEEPDDEADEGFGVIVERSGRSELRRDEGLLACDSRQPVRQQDDADHGDGRRVKPVGRECVTRLLSVRAEPRGKSTPAKNE